MMQKQLSKLELTGSFVAIACAIHCISIPILISLGGIGLLETIGHGTVEISFLVVTLLIAGWSIFSAYRNNKVNAFPLVMFGLGFSALIISVIFHFHILSAIGGIVIASAHFFNWRQIRRVSH